MGIQSIWLNPTNVYALDLSSHFFNHCFLYQEERNCLLSTIRKLIPKFSNLSDKKKTDILLHGINLDSEEPDSRNVPLTFAVQKFILQTRRF